MIDKIKGRANKKYTTISIYVIVTAVIIFILARATFEIENILKAVTGAFRYVIKILTPVFIGFIIAYVTNPLVAFIEKMLKKFKLFKFKNEKKYRTIAVLSCIMLIVLVIILVFSIFIFSITKQFSNVNIDEIISIITNYINGFSDSLKTVEGKFKNFNIESKTLERRIAQLSTILTNWLTNFANGLVAYTVNVSGYVVNFIFGLIIGIYLLLDKDDLFEYGNKLSRAMFSEAAGKKIKEWLGDLNSIFSGYIKSTLLDALLMCAVLSVLLSIIGIKFGGLIGILAGLCHLIPYFGPIVAFGGTLIFGILNAQYNQVLIAIIVLIIFQQIDVNIIQPKLFSSSLSLRPIFVLIALIIGANVGGVLGMILAVPIAAVVKLFLKRYIEERIKEKESKL